MPDSYLVEFGTMADDGQVFGLGLLGNTFYYSNDWGNSFSQLPYDEGIKITGFQYLGNNELIAMKIEGFLPFNAFNVISFSEDSGQNWVHNELPEEYYLRASGFHFFNANEGFIVGYEGFLIKTEDGGQTWEEITYDDERIVRNIHFVDEQTGWAVGDDGLVLSTNDGGSTWLVTNCGYHEDLISISALDAENCWLGNGDGIYLELNLNAESSCSLVNVSDQDLEEVHLLVSPNPTSAMVNICLLYTSPSPRDATLSRMPSSA